MIDFLIKLLGDPNSNKIKKMMPVVEHINKLEPEFVKFAKNFKVALFNVKEEILENYTNSLNLD